MRAARLRGLMRGPALPRRRIALKSTNSKASPRARIQSATANPVARGQGFRSAGCVAPVLGDLLAQRAPRPWPPRGSKA